MTTTQISDAFAALFNEATLPGAAMCLWSDEGPVVSLVGGRRGPGAHHLPWTEDTLVPVWSTTKGPAAATLLWALEHAGLSLDTPVSRIWPSLPLPISLGQLLSHQSGLAALDDVQVSVFDHEGAVAALERQRPAWPPGQAHGYHPRTFGTLIDECVRRITGARLATVWHQELARPLGLDVWFGVLETDDGRVADVVLGRMPHRPEEQEFVRHYSDRTSLTRRAFNSLPGLDSPLMMNRPEARRLGHAAFGGYASAVGLAQFYHALVSGHHRCFSESMRRAAEHTLVDGPDLVLRMPTAFSAGFQKDPLDSTGGKIRQHYGPAHRAFGHPGAGGSLAFGDPERRLGFAFVLNRIAPGVMPGESALSLVRAVYAGPAEGDR